MTIRIRIVGGALWLLLLVMGSIAQASARNDSADRADSAPTNAVLVDRVVARFEASELGGPDKPRFVFERLLAFEARIEALAERKRSGVKLTLDYRDRDVRAALERHITEEILASLPLYPPLTPSETAQHIIAAAVSVYERVGGHDSVLEAAYLEWLEEPDLRSYLERRARAAVYLDRMVTPVLNPSPADLREVLRKNVTPFKGQRFEDVEQAFRRWYIADRLDTELNHYYRGIRARLRITILTRS